MRVASSAALLARIVILFSASVCARGAGFDWVKDGGPTRQEVASQARKSNNVRASAEIAFKKAMALRQKGTGTDLAAAVRLFQTSAHLFAAENSYPQAADAYAQAADVYFVLGWYDEARHSYGEVLKIERDLEKQCRALSRIARTYAATGPLSLV